MAAAGMLLLFSFFASDGEARSNAPSSVSAPAKTSQSRQADGQPVEPIETVASEPAHGANKTSTSAPTLTRRTSGSSFLSRRRETTARDENPASPSRRAEWWVSTLIALAIVLAVILAAGRVLRRIAPGFSHGESGPIHVLYRTHLSPKQSLALIKCGNRLLLIGASGDQMRTLADITDAEEIDLLKGQCLQLRPHSTTKAFRDLWKRQQSAFHDADSELAAEPSAGAMASTSAPKSEDPSRSIDAARQTIMAWKSRKNA